MIAQLTEFALWYARGKEQVRAATGSTESLLHVHAGLLIFVVAALLLRKRMRSPLPIALVVIFALANEAVDGLRGRPATGLEPLIDIVNTIWWPAVLFVLARRWPDRR